MGRERRGSGQGKKNKRKRQIQSIVKRRMNMMEKERDREEGKGDRQRGTSLGVQWLRLCTSNAGGAGSISGQGTRTLHAAQHGK